MYFSDAVRVLLRRWYVVLAGVLLMGVAVGGVIKWVPTQYQASGQLLLLLPSNASGAATPTNPFLNLQEGLTTTASLIASSVSTKDTQRQFVRAGYSSDYTIEVLPGAGPLIVVTAKDNDPTTAVRTRDALMKRLADQLGQLQTEVPVPKQQVISSLPTNVGSRAEVLPGSKIRALGAIGGSLVVLTLLAAFGLDRFLTRKPGRRGRTQHASRPPDDGRHSSAPSESPDGRTAGNAQETSQRARPTESGQQPGAGPVEALKPR